jgi:predicted small metal-binding protein
MGRTFVLPFPVKESTMTRKFIDCREFPSDTNCSVAISADSEDELQEIAAQHAVAVHKHDDTPQLRQQLRQLIKDGMPPEQLPRTGQPASPDAGAARPH